jgi:hypothetical protein
MVLIFYTLELYKRSADEMRVLMNHKNLEPAAHRVKPRPVARVSHHASRRRAALAPVVQPVPAVTPAALDSDSGLGLLFRFLIATAIAVAAFMLAVEVDEMWILVPVMAVHLSVTFFVLKGIFNLLKN